MTKEEESLACKNHCSKPGGGSSTAAFDVSLVSSRISCRLFGE